MNGRPFGAASRYYQLYRRDPVAARKGLWAAYLNAGRSVRSTARLMGCSRNSVKALVKRLSADANAWGDRPARPTVRRRPRKRGQRIAGVLQAGCRWSRLSLRERTSIGVYLLKIEPAG